MAITKEFADAVQAKKLLRIRIMMKDSLLVDPSAAQFDEMERYASSRVGNLYAEDDNAVLNFDVTAWNEDYLNQQMVAVVNSFTKKRVELLKRMVRYLYKDRIISAEPKVTAEVSEGKPIQRYLGIGITAAGAVTAAAGICASETMLIAGGAVAAAAGVVLIVTDKGVTQ